MKKIRNLSRRTWIISSCTAAAAGATLGVLLTADGPVPAVVQEMPVSLGVTQVAALLHAARVTDCPGSGSLVGVTDSGFAYLGSERIGINTFPGPDIRDRWVTAVRNFGVMPFAQGSTWVAYKAVDQTAKTCNDLTRKYNDPETQDIHSGRYHYRSGDCCSAFVIGGCLSKLRKPCLCSDGCHSRPYGNPFDRGIRSR